MKFSNNKKIHKISKILIISSILFLNFFVNCSTAIRTQNEILEDNWGDDTTNANLQRMVDDLYPASMLSLTDPVELNMIRWQQTPTKNKRSNQPSVGKRLFLARIGKRGMMMPIYRARVG